MEVLDRNMLKHVAGAGGSAPIQKPISTTTDASGGQVQKFDLGGGVSGFVICTGVTGSVSFGISGRKVVQLDAGVKGGYTSCTLTTVKDGVILETRKVSEADVDNDDVQIAANGDISDSGDGGSSGESDGDGDSGASGDSGGGGGGGDDHTPNVDE